MSPLSRFPRERSDAPASATTPSAEAERESKFNHVIAARNEFSNAFGDLARGKRNWQLMSFALIALLAVTTLSYVRLASSQRVIPYLVQVDRLGQVLAIGRADETLKPDQRLVAAQLAQFVRAIRTVLPASAAAGQSEMIKRGYAFLAPEAAGFLNDYFADSKNDPRLLGARLTRQVDVTGILRVPNSDVWRLQWSETERPISAGEETRTTAWEGYATVKLVPPVTAEAVQDNPLGLYITTINWTQIAESTPDPVTEANDSSAIKRPASHE